MSTVPTPEVPRMNAETPPAAPGDQLASLRSQMDTKVLRTIGSERATALDNSWTRQYTLANSVRQKQFPNPYAADFHMAA